MVTAVVKDGKPLLVSAFTLSEEEAFRQMADPGSQKWSSCPIWVVERFYLYPWMRPGFTDLVAPQVIGAIRTAAARCGISINWSFASEAKTRITDDAIRSVGWWDGLPGKHCRDAARHALYHLVKLAGYTAKGK